MITLVHFWRFARYFPPKNFPSLLALAEEYALAFSPTDQLIEIESEVLRYVRQEVCGNGQPGLYLKGVTNHVAAAFPTIKIGWQKVRSALINLRIVNRFYTKKDGVYVYFKRQKVEEKAEERFGLEKDPQETSTNSTSKAEDLEKAIHEVLVEAGGELGVLAFSARMESLGFDFEREVLPVLYRLEREGKIAKTSDVVSLGTWPR